jgi:uncharacterized protein (TIGR02265 family)
MPDARSAALGSRSAVIAELCSHCDLVERLPLVPPSAKVRGLYFRSIQRVLTDAGCMEKFAAVFPERFAAVLWYPAADFLVRLAVGGALLAGPSQIEQGMFRIGRPNAVSFADSLIGRTLLRMLDRDPRRLLRQAIAGRRQSFSYGRWDLEFPEPRMAIVTMCEEYVYIESYLRGAAQGTFDAVGVPVGVEVELHDRFNGRIVMRW